MKRSKSVMGRQVLFRPKNRTQPVDFGKTSGFFAAATLSRIITPISRTKIDAEKSENANFGYLRSALSEITARVKR